MSMDRFPIGKFRVEFSLTLLSVTQLKFRSGKGHSPGSRSSIVKSYHSATASLVLEAMTSLFQRHDASAVERLYAPNYIQHNPNIPQGREALQALVADLSQAVYYEPGLIVAEGDFVAIHGRIRGWADEPQVVIDLFRVEGGKLAEHWDVLQNEVPVTAALGGISMFDPAEGAHRTQPGTA